jgi:hypothetical protein
MKKRYAYIAMFLSGLLVGHSVFLSPYWILGMLVGIFFVVMLSIQDNIESLEEL